MSVYHKERPTFLQQSIESLLNQTLLPTQIVLVKDGALTEGLDAVIDHFVSAHPALFEVVALPENVGLGRALNEGLNFCKYELVARMDSDDISLPHRFESQVKVFERDPSVAIVSGWITEFESDPSVIQSSRRLPETHPEIMRLMRTQCPLNHVTVMFKRSVVLQVGGYQHFYLLEDYYLWIRMYEAGAIMYNIQQPLVNVRGGQQMVARRGGLKYALSEVRLQRAMRRMGIIGCVTMCKNIAIRFTVRMLPNFLRRRIYAFFLRK